MRILLINVPHPSIGSRMPREQLPPLGLLSVGGPLIDDGHEVRLIDGELGPMREVDILAQAQAFAPQAVLFGHSGSTTAHPIIAVMARRIRKLIPDAWIIYGGVFPTYHWREVLAQELDIDIIVRGEGEATARDLMRALATGAPYEALPGLALRIHGQAVATAPAPVIDDLEEFRIGWELIDHTHYGYWGGKRAVVVQFSRGCPHLCNYCGQRGFWTRWRHRDPVKFAAEIARLHREHGVEIFNFADENPSAGRKPWLAFLEAVIAENISVTLVGSTRAGDIVRDEAHLHLYKRAGFERFLMGMENTDDATLKLIKKGASVDIARRAIQLLRKHNILAMATWVVGFEEERDRDYWRGLRALIAHDPDQIQLLYVTPHRWTPFFRIAADRTVIQTDQRRWDYKHQVLKTRHMPPWRVFLWVKLIEVTMQARPRALLRLLYNRDPKIMHAIRWYYRIGKRVWFHEIRNFLFRDRRLSSGPKVAEFWGAPQDAEEESMVVGVAKAERSAPASGAARILPANHV